MNQNSPKGDANQSNETIRQIAKEFFEQIWNQGDESAIDRFISADTFGNDPQFGTGLESFRTKWREWQNAFPDIHFRIDDVIVEGNQVVTKWHLTGTQTGELEGIPPSCTLMNASFNLARVATSSDHSLCKRATSLLAFLPSRSPNKSLKNPMSISQSGLGY